MRVDKTWDSEVRKKKQQQQQKQTHTQKKKQTHTAGENKRMKQQVQKQKERSSKKGEMRRKLKQFTVKDSRGQIRDGSSGHIETNNYVPSCVSYFSLGV